MIERVDAAAAAAAVIKLDILTLIIIRGRRSQRLEMVLLVLVWDETGGRCRIAALMDVAQVMMLLLRLEVLIGMIRVVWMGLLMVLMVLMLLVLLLLICGDGGATVDAALLLPRRVGMRCGGGGRVSHFRPPGNPRSYSREGGRDGERGGDLCEI